MNKVMVKPNQVSIMDENMIIKVETKESTASGQKSSFDLTNLNHTSQVMWTIPREIVNSMYPSSSSNINIINHLRTIYSPPESSKTPGTCEIWHLKKPSAISSNDRTHSRLNAHFIYAHTRSYERYLDPKMTLVLYLVIAVHLLLPIIEEPAVFKVPYWVPCCIELVCLTVYALRWTNARSFQTTESFKVDKKNFIVIIILIVSRSIAVG